jgi:hypothetical protein
MQQYLIEVPHETEHFACARVVQIFLATGSHFLSHAHWGCLDGNHSAWFIVEADSKDDARLVVPPQFRADARIIGLNQFTMDEIETILQQHQSDPPQAQ